MKVLSWNCRGLGNPTAVRALRKLLKTQCPDLVFLMETKLKNFDRKAKSSLACGPLSNIFLIDCTISLCHRSGGLAVLWNNVISIDILQSNKMFVDLYITSSNNNISWFASGIYGYPYHSQKHLTCELIKELHQNRDQTNWLIFGDFNLLLNSSEKFGGNGIDHHHTRMFNETLNHCDLIDLGYNGTKFTWANNHYDNTHINERIDRFCANSN
jgi:hypothetical protein